MAGDLIFFYTRMEMNVGLMYHSPMSFEPPVRAMGLTHRHSIHLEGKQ